MTTLVFMQSTDAAEAKHGFDYWRHAVLAGTDARPVESGQPFSADRLIAVSPHGTMMHTRSSAVVIERHARHVRGDGLDDMTIALSLRGNAHIEQGRQGTLVGIGEIGFASLDRPFAAGISERYEELRLHISRDVFQARVGSVEAWSGRSVRDGGPLGDQFASHMLTFSGSIARMTEPQIADAFEGALHILHTLVRERSERKDAPVSAAALRSLARAYIERRLHDPVLDPAEICASLCVSRSRLYAAFAEENGIAATIRDARLDRAHRRLSSAGRAGQTTAAIMLGCGFIDSAHFSRAFRRRFGLSPRDLRDMSAP